MLQALGFMFYDELGNLFDKIIKGKDLINIKKVVVPDKFAALNLNVICDVNNSLFGNNGATYIYGRQKGANDESLKLLEDGVKNFASLRGDINLETKGAGAAGGVGYASITFLNANLVSGNLFFTRLVGLEEKIKHSNLVISGEGKLDVQSLQGKVISGVYNLTLKYNKELVLFCGINELKENYDLGNVKIIALNEYEKDVQKCINNAEELLIRLSSNISVLN